MKLQTAKTINFIKYLEARLAKDHVYYPILDEKTEEEYVKLAEQTNEENNYEQ